MLGCGNYMRETGEYIFTHRLILLNVNDISKPDEIALAKAYCNHSCDSILFPND